MTECSPDQDVWQLVDDVEPINSGTVREGMFRFTGDIPTSDRVLTSMGRLLDEELIARTPVDDHLTGCDRRMTDEGREVAAEIVKTWADVLEGVDR